MAQSAIAAALVAKDHEALRAAIYNELVPTIASNVDPVTYDPRELGSSGGNIWPAVIWQDTLWFRDPDDSSTLADEITCIVTIDGSRYKTNDVRMPRSVLSRTLDTPPSLDSSPPDDLNYGDAWLVPAGATGAWADHEDEVAVWTARGWVYVAATIGDLLFVQDEGDEGEYIHFNAEDEWEDGLPGGLGLLSVEPKHLLIRAWAAENQTTNAPPGTTSSPPDPGGPAGETYIIGSSPTGDWAGHALKIAYRPALDADFIIVTPFVSEEVYDKALGIKYRWDGTAWVPAAGSYIDIYEASSTASTAMTATGDNTAPYAFHATTAPVKAASGKGRYCLETLTLNVTADYAGQVFEIKYLSNFSSHSLEVGAGVLDYMTGAVLVDGETTARDWQKKLVAADLAPAGIFPDVNLDLKVSLTAGEHTISIIFFPHATSDGAITSGNLTVIRRTIRALKRA